MLFKSFAHWVLISLGLFVLLVSGTALTLIAVKMQWLGEGAILWVAWAQDGLAHLYRFNAGEIDGATKLIGAGATVLGAVWTIHKGWHYAQRNLPKRIEDFNDLLEEESRRRRPASIAALADGTSIAMPEYAAPTWIERACYIIFNPRWQRAQNACRRVDWHKNAFSVFTSSRLRCRTELVTALLEHGAELSRGRQGQQALDAFREALRLSRSDLDALELAGRQAFVLDQRADALVHFQTMEGVAARQVAVVRQARAMRFQAEILKVGPGREPLLARNILKKATEILRNAHALDEATRARELCLAYGQLADVQMLRNVLTSARTALTRAQEQCARLDDEGHPPMKSWLDDLGRRLNEITQENDSEYDGDDADGDDAASSQAPQPPDSASGDKSGG